MTSINRNQRRNSTPGGRHVFVPDGLFQVRMLRGPRTSWWGSAASARNEAVHAVEEGQWASGFAELYERVSGRDVLRDAAEIQRRGNTTCWRR